MRQMLEYCLKVDHDRYLLFSGEGPRSRGYGRTAALRLIVQPCDEDDQFFFSPCTGAAVE
jgi:hypothetical protein